MQRASGGRGRGQIWAAQKCEASAASSPPPTHTALAVALCHTNWCASQARLPSPRPLLDWLLLSICLWLWLSRFCCLAATDIDFHTRATAAEAEAAAAAKMLQQDDSSTWAKKLPQFSNYSQNFMPTKATHSMHRQPKGVCHTHTHTYVRTQMELVGRQVLCNIFGCHCQQLLQPKRICAAVQHIQIQPAMWVCVCVLCACVWVLNFTLVRFSFHLLAKMLGKNSLNVANILLCLWLDFRCILTLFSSLSLSLTPSLISGTFLQTLFQPVFQSR